MLRPIFVHRMPDRDICPRFDSVMMPNGSIASLLTIAKGLLGREATAIDEAYIVPGCEGREEKTLYALTILFIEHLLRQGDTPVLLCSVLGYNAEGSLTFLRDMKRAFKGAIRTGVGGQQIRNFPEAFLAKPFLDHVAVGDAELTLAQIFRGKRFATGRLDVSSHRHYAGPCYDGYVGIKERLDEMSRYRLGPFRKIRQLVIESVRGCAWADVAGICHFCAIEGVDLKPQFRPFAEQFRMERELVEKYGLTWIFNVSNQLLPSLSENGKREFLAAFLKARRNAGIDGLSYYAYLTTSSITSETAPLLRQAGLRIAFVGVDGWDEITRRSLNKPRSEADRTLRACVENNIFVRLGFVLGSGVTRANLQELPRYVERLIAQYGSHILTMDPLLEIVLPGSPVWQSLEADARQSGWSDVLSFYDQYRRDGFLPWTDQRRFDQCYMQRTCPAVPYEELIQARDKAYEVIARSPNIIPITVECGGAFKL